MPDWRRSLVAGLLLSVAVAGQAAPSKQAAGFIAAARVELLRSDGIAAEINLKRALNAGVSREDVAALMGEAYFDQGQNAKAREWLGPAAFSRKDAAQGFRTLGRLERAEGHLPAAGNAYTKALQLTPENSMLWVDIARLRYAGEEHLLALEALDKSLELDPENIRAVEMRGQILRDQYGLKASLAWFEGGLALAPNDLGLLGEYAATLGDLGRASDMLRVTRNMLRIDPGNVRALYLQAVMAARAGDNATARAMLDRTGNALDAVPGAMLLDALLVLRSGNGKSAAKTLERLVARQPANMRAQMLLARAIYASGDYRYLTDRFGQIAARGDAAPYLMTLVARGYEAQGQRDLAAPLLDRAAFAAMPFVSPVMEGSQLGAMIASGNLAGALAFAENELSTNPGSANRQIRAGDAQLALGNGPAAAERYQWAARIRMPENLFLRLAEALSKANRAQDVVNLTDTFLYQNPTSRAAARFAAGLAAQSGDWSRAKLLLEHLHDTGGQRDVRLLADLSFVSLRKGYIDEAVEFAESALNEQSASPFAAQALGMALAVKGDRPNDAAALLAKARAILGDNPLLAEGRKALAAKR